MSTTPIPIIDLFAGPGGLGEGFSSLNAGPARDPAFKIALSVEKDPEASRTLRWRAFTRALYRAGVSANTIVETLAALDEPASPEPAAVAAVGDQTWKEAAKVALDEAKCIELAERTRKEVSALIEKRTRTDEPWVLIGGPPCQAYSLVGRARNRGILDYSAKKDHRHFLYREYLNVIGKHAPAVFVMENVKGILSAKVDSHAIFESILDDLRAPARAVGLEATGATYTIHVLDGGGKLRRAADSVVKMEDFGIPQRRHRVILVGVRDDLLLRPGTLIRGDVAVTAGSVLNDLPRLRSGVSRGADSADAWLKHALAIVAEPWVKAMKEPEKSAWLRELGQQLVRMQEDHGLGRGIDIAHGATIPDWGSGWYRAHPHDYVLNHSTRAHMASDLHRYLFAAVFARVADRSPSLHDFPAALLPAHENLHDREGMIFPDRFKVQVSNAPSSTVTSHIAKDGHYFIHPDPSQCRSLTVREAARLQTFPDDYYFCGGRTSQYTQVGNAVPPLLARQVAIVVHDALMGIERAHDPLARFRVSSTGRPTDAGPPTFAST